MALPLGDTRAGLCIAIILVMPSIAQANPVSVDGQSLIAFAIVALWALVIESGIVFLNTAAG